MRGGPVCVLVHTIRLRCGTGTAQTVCAGPMASHALSLAPPCQFGSATRPSRDSLTCDTRVMLSGLSLPFIWHVLLGRFRDSARSLWYLPPFLRVLLA